MVVFHRILVPVDYSHFSKEALKYAANVAPGTGAEIIVLHVSEPMASVAYIAPMGGYSGAYEERIEHARAYLAGLQPLAAELTCRVLVRVGQPGHEIVACAKEEGADVIVMATHGGSGLTRLLLGSTVGTVMRHATVPVLALNAAAIVSVDQAGQSLEQPETTLPSVSKTPQLGGPALV